MQVCAFLLSKFMYGLHGFLMFLFDSCCVDGFNFSSVIAFFLKVNDINFYLYLIVQYKLIEF